MDKPQKNILIVDDVSLVRSFLSNLLDIHDFESEFAVNGLEAVQKWGENEFSMILMDLDMPVMGGLEATKKIRQLEETEQKEPIPIVAVSGNKSPESQEKCAQADMNGFIPKPVIINEALETIFSYFR